jgi:hypothetical protein
VLETAAAAFEDWRLQIESSIATVRADMDLLVKRMDRSIPDSTHTLELVADRCSAGESID